MSDEIVDIERINNVRNKIRQRINTHPNLVSVWDKYLDIRIKKLNQAISECEKLEDPKIRKFENGEIKELKSENAENSDSSHSQIFFFFFGIVDSSDFGILAFSDSPHALIFRFIFFAC